MESMPELSSEQHGRQPCDDNHSLLQLSQFLEDSKDIDDHLYLSSEILGKLGTVLGKLIYFCIFC